MDINFQKEAYKISLLLSDDPFHSNLNFKKLTGFPNIYRVVVFKSYRLIYTFDNDNIYLLRIAHRKEIYKKFEL